MSQKQRTIRRPFTFRGKGLHTGLDITLTLRPAPENHGIKITRVDLPGKPVIDALAENVDGTTRGTVIKRGDVQVSTIEHALSALYALGGGQLPAGGGRARIPHPGRQCPRLRRSHTGGRHRRTSRGPRLLHRAQADRIRPARQRLAHRAAARRPLQHRCAHRVQVPDTEQPVCHALLVGTI